ncbi:PspC domain-containing protein [Pseudonocardia nigra]|uniref:PspC domain-containing protein n=1 Tax=Pseudonocardia nigra TaxID=1921578 RepID=UPI001C5D7927|nr:PspC domain-containing protein [Pseudonocardia nigra]
MEQTTDTTTRITFDKSTSGSDPLTPDAPVLSFPPSADEVSPADTGRRKFRLRRSRTDRMLGGVCGGLAAELDVDPVLLRIGLVALTALGFGTGAVIYVAVWLLAPEAEL